MIDAEFPRLNDFFAIYFHQDWIDDYENWQSAITKFAENSPKGVCMGVQFEIQQLIQILESPMGKDLDVLGALNCNYVPSTDGLTEAEWLKAVDSLIDKYR